MEITPELQERALSLQKESFKDYHTVRMNGIDTDYEAYTRLFVFRKLAELELRIEETESNHQELLNALTIRNEHNK